MEHRNIPAGQVGVPYNWRVANEAARNALVVSSDDVGKLLQQDDNGSVSYWTLWGASPADWRPVSGAPGAPGESFDPDEIGPIANRGSFDNEPPPFSYLADDEGLLYFRIGEAGNWSQGIPFGQGPAGAPGPGVAEGGTGGQFLRKVDGTDFNTYWGNVTSTDVGLSAFDGLTPATLPISTATQTALDAKANSSDVTSALDGKVDKVTGLGLSQESFTSAEKTKLTGIATGATANATNAALRDRSTHTGTQAISTVTGLQSALDEKSSNTALALKANIASPSFTGTPSAPTPAADNNTTQLQTTAGSLLQMRQFGIGGVTRRVANDFNFDTASDGGLYSIASAVGNTTLPGSNTYTVLNMPYAASLANDQIVMRHSSASPEMWFRSSASSVYSTYQRVATQAMIDLKANSSDVTTSLALKADKGSIGASGLTMSTSRLLGRNTTATGAIEEITLGTGLSMTGTTLNASVTDSPIKAWVNFNGTGTVAIRASFNVSSITDNGTGDYTINFSSAISSANYAPLALSNGVSGSQSDCYTVVIGLPSASSCRIKTINNPVTAASADASLISFSAIGG